MSSKLCPHIQRLDSVTLEAIQRLRPPMVKTMDVDRHSLQAIRSAAPDALIVARAWQENQDYYSDPVAAGMALAATYAPILGSVDVVEVFNEAINNLTPPEDMDRFDAFQLAFAHAVWELDDRVRIGLFCLPTGNWGYSGEPTLQACWRSMELPKNKVFICLHEYSWNTWDWQSPARCLRYRRQMDGLSGYQVLITECGLTHAVVAGCSDVGWRTGIPRNVFVDGAAWYDSELQKDECVLGAAMFTCGPSYGWDTFECAAEWEEAVNLSPAIAPVFETPIRILHEGEIETLELDEYLRGVVPAEMPALWNIHALMAQAVTARSYAMWRIENPRGGGFDLYGDARDQVYDPKFIHARSDEAIRATAGITWPGVTRYVSRCGRGDCPWCRGAAGYNDQSWPGRMCQYGARYLGDIGMEYWQILNWYYGGGEMGCPEVFKDPATDAFSVGPDGRVTGCRVDIQPAEQVQAVLVGEPVYRVVKLLFLNEEQARGDTRILVQVLDRNGVPTVAKVINAWPQQKEPNWDGTTYDWSSPAHVAEFAQGGGNYDPARDGPLGPYVIFIEQNQEKQTVKSDWCVGFGLPGNRHVAYQVVYQECVAGDEEPPAEENPGCGALVAAVIRLLERLAN